MLSQHGSVRVWATHIPQQPDKVNDQSDLEGQSQCDAWEQRACGMICEGQNWKVERG